jgi:hypothetical protein
MKLQGGSAEAPMALDVGLYAFWEGRRREGTQPSGSSRARARDGRRRGSETTRKPTTSSKGRGDEARD